MWKDACTDDSRPLGSNSASPRNTSRRKRTSFSKEHVELLKATFKTDPYPGISLRESLSQSTGLPESRIQVWFQNRRARTLKCKGAKKSLWQPDSPVQVQVQVQVPEAHLTPNIPKRATTTTPAQCPPPGFIKEERPPNPCYFNQRTPKYSTPVYNHLKNLPSYQGYWSPSVPYQAAPTTPMHWSNSPVNNTNMSYNNQSPFVHPGQMSTTPDTPDSGFWDSALDVSPQTSLPAGHSHMDDLWVAPETPAPRSLAPLPELSLQEILGELEEDWLGGTGNNSPFC